MEHDTTDGLKLPTAAELRERLAAVTREAGVLRRLLRVIEAAEQWEAEATQEADDGT
jgi:hypothetical protein